MAKRRADEPPEQDEVAEDLSRVPKPGQIIRATRIKRELSREELSERTRLTESVLVSVEADDYPALGEPVYARGYYRKCAEVLGLNGELLVEAYEKRSGTGSPVPVIQQRPSIRYREGPGIWKAALIVLMLGALAAAAAWWLLQSRAGAAAAGTGSAQAEAPPQVAEAARPTAKPRPAPSAAVRAPAPQPVKPAMTARPRPQATPVAVAVRSGTPVPATPPPARPARRELPSGPTPSPRSASDAAQPVLAPLEPQWLSAAADEAIPEPVLKIHVHSGESWIDVADDEGRKLVYKLLPGGAERQVSGRPPLRISLGRADQVRMWWNGEPLDLSGVIQPDLRARFRILSDGQVEG